ncbi:LPS export ABC transporter periplasmic protein LptC [uncultured Roseibium sp.]|uniref:LPS export ABC transporter periplasmic protein LptC n=1 Tax=uncultured Roseibium sp. TaxID=1936171 RepID=UPI003216C64B
MTLDVADTHPLRAALVGVREMTRAQKTARRHSRAVRFLRFFFPAVGVLIFAGMVGLIVVFNYLSDLGIGAVSLTSEGLVMHRPELSGHDGDRSYRVTATRAVQRLSNPMIIDLEMIRADIVPGPNQLAKVTALKGIFDNSKETLKLYDGLQLEWSEGYTVDLSEVSIDLKTGEVRTDEPISIRSEKGTIRAGRLSYDQEAGKVRFTDGIKMTLQPTEQGK